MSAKTRKPEDAMALFLEKSEELLASKFSKFVLTKQTGAVLSFKKEESIESINIGPSVEETKAFVLTLRFLIQGRDGTSLRQIEEILKQNASASFERYSSLLADLNTFLEAQSSIAYKSQRLTRHEIFETFIYGKYAHSNPDKEEAYKNWAGHDHFPFIENEFNYITKVVLGHIKELRRALNAGE